MRVVIHVGMPKTGTSSIQAAYHRQVGPGYEYGDLAERNHSAGLALIFDDEDRLADFPGFWPKGEGFMRDIPRHREVARARLFAQMDRLQGGDDALVLSAEALWSARRQLVRVRLRDEIARRGARAEVICYVRPPLSYAVSAFQQRLKGAAPPRALSFDGLWPSYRRSIQGLDAAFGRARVTLRPYARSELAGGDVVEDFAQAMDLPLARPEGGWPRSNETLGAEAAAFLYAQRRGGLAFPTGFPSAMAEVRALIAGLRALGSRRFTFDPALFAEATAERRDEIAWTEARLGRSLAEPPDGSALVIRSEADLLRLGREVEGHDAAQAFLEGLSHLARRAPADAATPQRRPDLAARRAARLRDRESRRRDA